MSVDLLLEVGTEEIPAGFLPPALAQLAETARAELEANRITFGKVETHGTPRRIVLVVRDVALRQPDVVEERVGPSVAAAFDADGNPTRAAIGFAKGQGVDVSALERKETEKGLYIAVSRKVEGRETLDVLVELLPKWISGVRFPKTMRWGDETTAFVRPVHWIVALLGEKVVPFCFAGIESGRTSRGHRFHSPQVFEVADANDYLEKIKGKHVVLNPDERREMIRSGVAGLAESLGGKILLDEDLLSTVANLVEYPFPLTGSFDSQYLELPRELLILTMKTHQKYFSVEDKSGKLMNHFIAVSNTNARDMDVVARGNERVLRARLADARFFYDEDLKKSLDVHVQGLNSVVFQAKLGTSFEKIERFSLLADAVADRLCPGQKAAVAKIALLCKADLSTQMVYEFPELQGIMGREYALNEGLDSTIAHGIEQHYWPTHAGGPLPESIEADCVSIADKLDTIAGCFGVGLIPSGNADPYALRRQTLGVLRILCEKGYKLGLGWLLDETLKILSEKLTRTAEETKADVLDFFRGRLEGLLVQEGLPGDIVQGVVQAGFDDVDDCASRARVLAGARTSGALAPLTETFKRVANILKNVSEIGEPDPKLFAEKAEASLWDKYLEIRAVMESAAANGDYENFLISAAELKPTVDNFFDSVLVMDNNPDIKNNRLALVASSAALFRKVADFTRIA